MIDPRAPDYQQTPCGPDGPSGFYRPPPASAASDVERATSDAARAPAVSIVTAFFDAGALFGQTAGCVFGQSLQDWEWIIVDDASTDPDSLRALEDIKARDPRVRVVRLAANSGPGAARNAGYAAARAELVFQLDADDLIEPTALEKLVWFLRRRPELSFANTFEVGFGAEHYLWAHGFHDRTAFLDRCMVGAHAVLVRKSAHALVGGYDEAIRGGMEDWEFWLRCADKGLWGATLPEYLTWYRRRERHGERWADWDGGEREQRFRRRLRLRFPRLYKEGIPPPAGRPAQASEPVEREPGLQNPLRKESPRALFILPWLNLGGADQFNLGAIEQLRALGWEITVATTRASEDAWAARFAQLTPDLFSLPRFLRRADHPAFLRYLIESRRPDVVLISQSEAGYLLLPWLRALCPGPAYVDYLHIEEPDWKNGGYPRYSLQAREQLDLTLVSSEHLRGWMIAGGAEPARVEVCTINVDAAGFAPDAGLRAEVRGAMGARGRERIERQLPLAAMGERLAVLFGRAQELRTREPRPAVSPGLGHDAAVRAVEYLRLDDLDERLWRDRRERPGSPHPLDLPATGADGLLDTEGETRAELARIEGTLAFRLLQKLKESPPYRAFARARYGEDWADHLAAADPATRLQRLKQSRFYKALASLDRLRPRRR